MVKDILGYTLLGIISFPLWLWPAMDIYSLIRWICKDLGPRILTEKYYA